MWLNRVLIGLSVLILLFLQKTTKEKKRKKEIVVWILNFEFELKKIYFPLHFCVSIPIHSIDESPLMSNASPFDVIIQIYSLYINGLYARDIRERREKDG